LLPCSADLWWVPVAALHVCQCVLLTCALHASPADTCSLSQCRTAQGLAHADMVETVLLQRGIKGTLPVRLVYRSLYCVFTGECRMCPSETAVLLARLHLYGGPLIGELFVACSICGDFASILRRPDGFHWVRTHPWRCTYTAASDETAGGLH
jgi:hypothetical protein